MCWTRAQSTWLPETLWANKGICIQCIKLRDHKNEFCHLLYMKSLYQMYTLFIFRPTVKDGKQTVLFHQRLTNSCEWTLSRSPLEVVSYHWNLDRVFLINSRVLSKILGMLPYLSLVALEKKKQKMNWVLQLSFVQLFPCSWCYWFYLPLFL